MLNKPIITQNDVPVANCDEFLNTLFLNAPEELFLELRCIHPTNGQVRSLWTDVHNLKATLEQAKKLNEQGYGVYFAPCLRSERKGTAQSASYVPAIWVDIDCENDPTQREEALKKLDNFDLKPSVVIDSGGGWHAYWLLQEPYMLESDDNRTYSANLLKGLFQVLGGDEGYVKSVASVMRLPDTFNTKPERKNACVQITNWHPDHRYTLSEFEWLEVKPTSNNLSAPIFSTNVNGNHVLPQRTEQYLVSGAFKGDRNRELFAAACQLRDAGYSQVDAEGQLVTRYVADGNGSENPTGREKEAKSTIASAYSQLPREPITSPKQYAREVVEKLVGNYPVKQKPDRPSTEQIVEAVEACVHMNAVEWAEQREKFKQITGDGLKISDIDQLYREKKKAREREAHNALVDTEEYLEFDNQMIYRRHSYRGTSEKVIANWTGKILERLSCLNDDGEQEHITVLEVCDHKDSVRLEVPSETFGDDIALRRLIAKHAGESFAVRAGMTKHLVSAILALSGNYPIRKAYRFMGWQQIADRWVYLTPEQSISGQGKLAEPPLVELQSRLHDYGVQPCAWDDATTAFSAMTRVFPPEHVSTCIAFALLPLLQRFFPSAAPKPALHLAGTYGSGKSELAALMSGFYGNFNRDTPPAQWGDTINTVEILGHPLSDALYWVDDFKAIYADERTFTRFLQSYSRGMGRGRLTREAKLRKEKPCRGLILSTGETTIEGEASVLSRMLVLEIPPWEQRDPQGKYLLEADQHRHHLQGFTAHFASWIARQLESGELQQDIANRFATSVNGYRKKLSHLKGKQSNTGRLIQNWAVLVTVYQVLSRFLIEKDADYVLPTWQDSIEQTIDIVREERASEVFLNVLEQLIASGEVILAENRQNPIEPTPGKTIIGYKDGEFIHLLPEIAFRAVNRIQPLKFTVSAIGSQMKEDGILLTHDGGRNLTVRIRVQSNRIRAWRLRADVLDGTD